MTGATIADVGVLMANRGTRLQGRPMSHDNAEETKARMREWIEATVRQHSCTPTNTEISARFGVSRSAAANALADYNREQE